MEEQEENNINVSYAFRKDLDKLLPYQKNKQQG